MQACKKSGCRRQHVYFSVGGGGMGRQLINGTLRCGVGNLWEGLVGRGLLDTGQLGLLVVVEVTVMTHRCRRRGRHLHQVGRRMDHRRVGDGEAGILAVIQGIDRRKNWRGRRVEEHRGGGSLLAGGGGHGADQRRGGGGGSAHIRRVGAMGGGEDGRGGAHEGHQTS